MTRHFTSDHHFGHQNIMRFADRPWRFLDDEWFDVEEMGHEDPVATIHEEGMHNGLIGRWNARVAPEDTVYVLGDFMWHDRLLSEIVPCLHGNILLVPGNHDSCWRGLAHWRACLPLYEKVGIEVLQGQETVTIGDEEVLLCHFPYGWKNARPTYKDKYSGFRPDDEGGWLLHGHTHEREKLVDKQIHIGVDAWEWYPVSEYTIQDIIETGTWNE